MPAELVETEAEFQASVVDLAQVYGFLVVHFRAARTKKGWRTPLLGDGAGFPDLILVRPPDLIFAELKAERGRPSPAQRAWLEVLARVPGVDAYLWRPSDWPEIAARLRPAA